MKILINGCEIKEILQLERKIKELKKNKVAYKVAVVLIALWIDSTVLGNALAPQADTFKALEQEIGSMLKQLIDLVLFAVKYGCIAAGLKEMGITLINGGSVKEAIFTSLNYWALSWFSSIYPSIF